MSKGSSYANSLLLLIFNAANYANMARNAISGTATLSIAIHTADPGVGGTQSTNEIAYTGYNRVLVSRSSAGWTVSGASVSPAAAIVFPRMTGGAGGTVTFWSIGPGDGSIMYKGAVAAPIPVVAGIIPVIDSTSTIAEA